jgi:anti-sigma regulatory factor (Ser/Thr protein kinase)
MSRIREFPCESESVTAARHFVREVLREQPSEVAELAELMASELATNSVRHARSDFEIAIRLGEEIRVEVSDAGTGDPARLSPGPEDPSGRGLLIVEAMADDWGVLHSKDGKTVWFTLAGPAPGAGQARRVRRSSSRAG